jgi:hypothetical protein
MAKKAGKSARDAERYWKEAGSCDKLPGDRKYRCKMGTVKKRLGVESFNPDLKYYLVKGWEQNDGLINEEWYGAVSDGENRWLVILDGLAAQGASINVKGVVEMKDCAVMEGYFEDAFVFDPVKSTGDRAIFSGFDGHELHVAKDGRVECTGNGQTKVAGFRVKFPDTGSLSAEDEDKIVDWQGLEEEVSTGAVADVMAGKPKVAENAGQVREVVPLDPTAQPKITTEGVLQVITKDESDEEGLKVKDLVAILKKQHNPDDEIETLNLTVSAKEGEKKPKAEKKAKEPVAEPAGEEEKIEPAEPEEKKEKKEEKPEEETVEEGKLDARAKIAELEAKGKKLSDAEKIRIYNHFATSGKKEEEKIEKESQSPGVTEGKTQRRTWPLELKPGYNGVKVKLRNGKIFDLQYLPKPNWSRSINDPLRDNPYVVNGVRYNEAGMVAVAERSPSFPELDVVELVGEPEDLLYSIPEGEVEKESYNDNYVRGMDKTNRTREADGATPANNEWFHLPSGKTGILESRTTQYLSIKCGGEFIVDQISEFREVGPEPVLEGLMAELRSREFIVQKVGNRLVVSKGMFRAGEIQILENKVIYEIKGLAPQVYIYVPEKLVTIIDQIFGKRSEE